MSKIVRYALIVVFEYRLDASRISPNLTVDEPPCPLLSMFTDLCLMYQLAKDKFGISESNITIVTDIRPPHHLCYPWKMKKEGNNINLIRLNYPCIETITRSIAQFVENTIRGIKDLPVIKGESVDHEIFFYASSHGALIPASLDIYGCIDDEDTALMFLKREGTVLKRAYLRRQDIFSILFGHINVAEDGTMRVPYTNRIETKDKRSRVKTHTYIDNNFEIKLTPTKLIDERSDRLCYAKSDRGLPIKTKMLTIIDCCHSQSMTDFHFVYDPQIRKMIPTNKMPIKYPSPFCVSIAASENASDAPSTSNGSPFTRTIFNIFNNSTTSETIKTFHTLLYDEIPRILLKCKPTITATTDNSNSIIPFLTHLPLQQLVVNEEPSILSSLIDDILGFSH